MDGGEERCVRPKEKRVEGFLKRTVGKSTELLSLPYLQWDRDIYGKFHKRQREYLRDPKKITPTSKNYSILNDDLTNSMENRTGSLYTDRVDTISVPVMNG